MGSSQLMLCLAVKIDSFISSQVSEHEPPGSKLILKYLLVFSSVSYVICI